MFEIGTTLREARRAKDLEILECEEHTRIRGKYLRALEAEQFDVLPSPTYVRGFLKTYAEFLELDAQLLLDEHESRFGALNPVTGDVERAGRPTRIRSRRSRKLGRTGRRTEAHLLWIAIGGVLGAGLLIWMGVGSAGDTAPPIPPSNPVEAPAGPNRPAETLSRPPAPVPGVDEDPLPRGEAPQRLSIVVSGVGEGSYVEIRGRNETGREVFRGTLEAGQDRAFTVSRGIWVRSGNTDGLVISVNGQERELAGGVADFLVTASGVQRVSG